MKFQTLFLITYLFSICQLQAQNNTPHVKPLKPAYEWNEKVTVEYSGLPVRDAYSNRYDDIILVPAGTPDGEYGGGPRVYVSKPSGQVEFVVPGAGAYEVRVYLYEKPGVVAARSASFRVLSVNEGSLETKTDAELVQITMRNRGENKDLMCQAISEFFRRKPAATHPNYKGMKAMQSLCATPAANTTSKTTAAIYPIKARYQCYRILSTGNEVAEDLYILDGKRYKTMNKVGTYTYDPKTRILTFTSGPLYIPSARWVGVYTGKGEPSGNGGTTVAAIIEIRRKADVDAGNKKVLQQCSCTQ